MNISINFDEPYMCLICRGAGSPWDTIVCESCWRNHHLQCGSAVWLIREGYEVSHMLCAICVQEEDWL